VHDSLGLAGAAAGVEDEQRVSASIGSGSHQALMSSADISSSHQRSLPSFMSTSMPRADDERLLHVGALLDRQSTFFFRG